MNAFNNYAANQGYNMGMGGMQPMQYNPAMNNQRPSMTNPLTDEERKLLQTQDDCFDLKVTPVEIAKAVCTHKDPQKNIFTTIPNADGTVTCTQCHETFSPNEVDEAYVEDAKNRMLNVLQTCKMIGVDLMPDVVRQYFAMIPYIERTPKLYKRVNSLFQKYNTANPVQPQANPNIFGMFNTLVNPAVPMGMPTANPYAGMQPQTPYMGMQQNMVAGNPMYQQPMMGYPQQPGMGMPQQGYPQQQGYPNMQQQPMNQPVNPQGQQQTQQQNQQQGQPNADNNVQFKEQIQL